MKAVLQAPEDRTQKLPPRYQRSSRGVLGILFAVYIFIPPKPLQKIVAIGVLPENLPARDASNDNGMSREGG
jgi:hypothetical protein